LQGKVRDTYDLGDRLLIVTTDRQSAFDRLLAAIPFKGQVLNQTSAWWMHHTQHIIPNALLSLPDPNACVMKKCTVFPVEFVVRGFMTGSTETSLWTHYKAGQREYCGNTFPDGMRKNDRLGHNVITPTTKAVDHDVPISPSDIVDQGLMTSSDWEVASKAALALFEFGQAEALQRGLLLVDTKYEFGKDVDGNILLIDEIHTPDSSRYWMADTYEARHAAGEEPQNIDKEFLRLWFRANCDPYNDPVLPEAPPALVTELSRRYVLLYETITGEAFVPPPQDVVPAERIKASVIKSLK
jgi:phosphoribosylaminoimidazole-succinocarboxamide synthase